MNAESDQYKPTDLDKEIFERDLSDAFLLVEHVSGRADKSLMSLPEIPSPYDTGSDGKPVPMRPAAVIEAMCLMRYPPEGSKAARAKDATLLLMARDELAKLAEPARGFTIAYTAMFIGIGLPPSTWQKLHSWLWSTKAADNLRTIDAIPRTRSLAIRAYPEMDRSARAFRLFFGLFFLLAFLVFGAVSCTTWDVAVARSILDGTTHLEGAKPLINGTAGIPAQGETQANRRPQGASLPVSTLTQPTPTTETNPAPLLQQNGGQAGASTNKETDAPANDDKPKINWGNILSDYMSHGRGWSIRLALRMVGYYDNSVISQPAKDLPTEPKSLMTQREMLRMAHHVVSNYMLPSLFGLLGTILAVVLTVQRKVRESLLGPRDFRMLFLGLIQGAAAGATVGLVVGVPSVDTRGAWGIQIGVAGLAFLAGYGSDQFFQMLDSLVRRIFNADPPANTRH